MRSRAHKRAKSPIHPSHHNRYTQRIPVFPASHDLARGSGTDAADAIEEYLLSPLKTPKCAFSGGLPRGKIKATRQTRIAGDTGKIRQTAHLGTLLA